MSSAALAASLMAARAGPATAAGVRSRVTTTFYVAPPTGRSRSLPIAGRPPYTDVNAAVAAAMPGDTVVVCPGTYNGFLTIRRAQGSADDHDRC